MADVSKPVSPDEQATTPPEPMDNADIMRHKHISEGAYFLSEARGFASGKELDDWLAAEAAFEYIDDEDD